jgi:ketosteroid isomerase-like protein
MASQEAIIDTILRAYDARGRGDIEGLMAAFHPDGVFELKGDKAVLAVAGAVEGHPNVRAIMTGLIEAFEFKKRDIISTMIDGNRAIVHSRVEGRFVPKDTAFTTDLLDTFRFEDGKIIELVEFADTALIKSLVSA